MTTTITPEEIETLRDLADDSGDMEWRRWADALATKIEAMQAENAALKKRIKESAREHQWKVNDCWLELWIFGTWLYTRFSRFGDKGESAQKMAEAEARGRTAGHIRHIDTIIRPEGV